jgi:O-antigen/teichoic acid export membrane protein
VLLVGNGLKQTMVSTPQERKRLIQGVIVVGAGLAVPQVLAYAASVIAARLLVPAEFGAFGAMQGITQIGTPIGLAIQAIAARRLVKNSANKHHDLLKFGLEISIAVMLATLLISFPLSSIFYIDYLVLVLTIGAIAPFVFISTQLGIAQGKEFYLKLAGIYIVFGIGRSVSAIVGLFVYPELISVGIGFFGGTLLSAIVAHFVLGNSKKFWKADRAEKSIKELWKATQALFALYVLVNIDVLLARVVLTPEESGIYTVGMLVAKIAFFMPQAITIVLFPKMGKNDSSALRLAVLGTSLIGAMYIGVTYFASEFVVNAIGGSGYAELYSEVWFFAIEGSLFAVLQVLLYGRIAREDTKVSILLWAGSIIAAISVWLIATDTIITVVLSLIVVTFILVIVAATTELRHRANERSDSSHT